MRFVLPTRLESQPIPQIQLLSGWALRHKGLARLFTNDDRKLLNPQHVAKIRLVLAALDTAATVEQLDLPGYRLHQLIGDDRGFWSITVRANWRIVFRFVEGGAFDVDLVDFHSGAS